MLPFGATMALLAEHSIPVAPYHLVEPEAAGQLAARGREWIATLDINPLIYGPDGFHAVDALLLLRDPRG